MRRLRSFAGLLLLVSWFHQDVVSQTNIAQEQAFRDLFHDGVAMNVSAHPDDEDGATLAYYRMKLGVRTASVLFTRGEGGQNETGPELYEELGVLRSAETEKAGDILGAEVRFLNFRDFGYSKTGTESFRKWGGLTEVLRRLVYAIRMEKPDVIFTNHNTVDGHGHHQAVANALIAAFDGAGDATVFPEQVALVGVWQPRKLFFRVRGSEEPLADVSHDVSTVDEHLGEAYVDIAQRALQMHRTQGMSRIRLRDYVGDRTLYRLVRANSLYRNDSTSFFGGIEFWDSDELYLLQPLRRHTMLLHRGMARDSILLVASRMFRHIDSLKGNAQLAPLAWRVLSQWENAVARIVELSCGISKTFRLADSILVAGQEVDVSVLYRSSECDLVDMSMTLDVPPGWSIVQGGDPETGGGGMSTTLVVGNDAQQTLPGPASLYRPHEWGGELEAQVTYSVGGYRLLSRVSAEFDVIAPHVFRLTPKRTWVAPAQAGGGIEIAYSLSNHMSRPTEGMIRVSLPPGWRGKGERFAIQNEDQATSGTIKVYPRVDVSTGSYLVEFSTEYASERVSVSVFEVAVAPGLNIGIVKSYDTTLETAVSQLDCEFALLTDSEIAGGDLSRFTTILVDIRAYLVRDTLRKHAGRLLEYVREGGNLVVMYQRTHEWRPEYAPYPFQISRKRISNEEAVVEVLHPDHTLMTVPNLIGPEDWDGWKQERGLYFPVEVSSEYTLLLSSRDPDEPELRTGYLVGKWGSGSYIYSSYVWYRQLRENHTGAFRCFANMLSYPVLRD
jgi:LmbE family N-acetylglucosaminyl deacetylase